MIEKADMKEYQKPELTYIDDPAFDEMGQGDSGIWTPPGLSGNPPGQSPGQGGNPPGQSGNHYGGGHGGGKSHK